MHFAFCDDRRSCLNSTATRGAASSDQQNLEPGLRLTDEQRIDWLRLIRSDNVGPRTFRNLLNHCGSARAALDALPELARRGGAARTARISSRADAERELKAAATLGIAYVALGESDYPRAVAGNGRPAASARIKGQPDILRKPLVAIVGSRNASAAGMKFAASLARDLGAAASSSHRDWRAASMRPPTVQFSKAARLCVLAGGLDRVYPPEHLDMFHDIVETGAALSEMPIGWEPRARDFPRRNRLISGISLGVIVIEAAAPFRFADHGTVCARTGPRGFCGTGFTARPAQRGHQRAAQARRGRRDGSGGCVRRVAADARPRS